ncbi:DivIVA domain-containing protein [Aeromicrobium wangtongii]|uniref:Cell wall synthesis protein Wag31 n=1 Tax=Aeromicrobium wangtongii TaxID=2969247 RepID=A0ABY5MA91_9ACTN|nr:DivIVA domain-containing protein [Aeromicrobium wangtongii]MCD9197558.1 DivIVA domain-containing protein [Aeromicrobium wangtongii]MCL3818473.1 DivIVA domain-containing protein [Aeromicrobium wangtongii]UUP15050.1 DivIVA domain-containing protein [Aeromicrobium wangtongii]
MPLTPEDVRNKRFTPVRLREGYDMGEVDQFLDEVEAELERLTVENEELRAKVAAASTGEPTGLIPAVSSATPAQAPPTPAVQEPAQVAPPAPEPKAEPEPAPAPAAAPAARPSMGDASSAAARLLQIASNNADQLMDAAKEEADRMVGEARTKAERITNEARGKADRLETDARIRAQKLDEETDERRTQAVATIERERYEIQREVEHLRAYEREYRARLKNYFQSQLDQLAANESTTSSTPVQTPAEVAPRRLRSLLGDDENV